MFTLKKNLIANLLSVSSYQDSGIPVEENLEYIPYISIHLLPLFWFSMA